MPGLLSKLKIFTRKSRNSKVWWLFNPDDDGGLFFSFDKKKIYALFGDYPDKLTPEEKTIFDKEEPYWADFFKGEE